MKYATAHALLSLPESLTSPDAYRVLGLASMEADRAKIKTAGDAAVGRLQSARKESDPIAWQAAVALVKDAQTILLDANKKAAYDRKLAATAPVIDPLAGLLPGQSSQAPTSPSFVPQPVSSSSFPNLHPPRAAGNAPLTGGLQSGVVALEEEPQPVIPLPKIRAQRPTKYKKRLPWLSILMMLFCVIALATLGGVVYLVQFGKPIVINTGIGPLITTGTAASAPMPVEATIDDDPVMGDLTAVPPPKRVLPDFGTADQEPPNAAIPVTSPSPAAPSFTVPTIDPPNMTALEVPMTNQPPTMPAAGSVDDGEKAIANCVNTIKRADWTNLVSTAESAVKQAVDDDQKVKAAALYQYAELVHYFRQGLIGAIPKLSGKEFDLSNDIKVVIVEATKDSITIRRSGKNTTYPINDLPPILLDRFGELTMPKSPTTKAALQVYRSVLPRATPVNRTDVAKVLKSITEPIEGTDTATLLMAMQLVYGPV